MTPRDEELLRAAFVVARKSRENGNDPFGAVLVGPEGEVLLEGLNTVRTERDCTGHAETNLMSAASRRFDRDFLATCTMYTSAEPCAMCSAATFWANVRRVVFGLDEPSLIEMKHADPSNSTLGMRSVDVFATGRWPVEVVGPCLVDEAREVHAGFWD